MRVGTFALILLCSLGAALLADEPPADKNAARKRVDQLASMFGELYKAGRYAEARSLYERALAIHEKALGPDHPDTATSLNNLALLLQTMGDLAGARPLYERALAIREKALGSDHPHTAFSLNNLAALLQAMGELRGARPLFERALVIREKSLGPDHPDTAVSLSNLAALLQAMGDLAGARPLYERALAIREKALGPDHPATAQGLNSLAVLLQAMGDMKGARPLVERALAINEKALGPDHPDTATSLNNLALLLQTMGDLAGARPPYERALAIREKALGTDHLDTALCLNNLAVVLEGLGDLKGAMHLYERGWKSNRDALHTLLPALSSREQCAAVEQRAGQLEYYLSAFPDDPDKTYSAALAWKGAALRTSAAAQRLPADASNEARRVADQLSEARSGLARLPLVPPTPKPGEPSFAEQYDGLRRRVEELERRLAEALPDFAARAFLEVEPPDVEKTLHEGAALLDVLENCGNLHAWVVRRNDVKYFLLGKASDFEPLALRFREALEKDEEKAWSEAGRALRERLARPLEAALEDAKELYVSPDGALATIPWGLLPDGDHFLVERLPIVCVSGGAGVVMLAKTQRSAAGEGLLAFGDVDYDGIEGAPPRLPATKAEVEHVAALFQGASRVLTGKEASKAAFLREASKSRYLHVATHGFFDLEHLRVALAGTRGFSGEMTKAPVLEVETQQKQGGGGWNPLLLSGIVLAKDEKEGGWLTADELQSIDLRGVDLVVLSACETGCGELAAGEGVLGLGRSLFVAGARGFMLSLWQVPDTSTRDLMDGFYDGLWTQGLSAEDALGATQLRMLSQDREANSFHPSRWGAWVLFR